MFIFTELVAIGLLENRVYSAVSVILKVGQMRMFSIFPERRAVIGGWWLPVLVILAVSFGLRLELYLLHPDAAWFSLAADKWLAGGRFFSDIFEINHPLVTVLHVSWKAAMALISGCRAAAANSSRAAS